jgi:RNA polymerase sigma-70 factor, ECF subfamily
VLLALRQDPHFPVSPPIATSELEFQRLYEANHTMVFRAAFRVTGNASDAEDVMQTVFLRLMKRDTGLVENPESYLRRAAVNASIDLIRERQKANSVALDEAVTPSVKAEMGELKDSLRKALAQLDERQSVMFAMRYFEGYSNQEIAKMMGMSQVHVAVILHRVKAKLQKELK